MLVDAVEVKYIEDYKLEITFETGEKGIVDLREFIHDGGVFSRFKDLDYFKKVYVNEELGVLCWPGDLDIAPETIYSMATGKPLPEWVEEEKQQGIKQI